MWLNFYVLSVYVSMANCSFYVSVEPTFLPELVRYCLCVGSALWNATGEFPFRLQIMHIHKLVLFVLLHFFLQIFMNADVHIYLFVLSEWHCRSRVRFTGSSTLSFLHSVFILSLTIISLSIHTFLLLLDLCNVSKMTQVAFPGN